MNRRIDVWVSQSVRKSLECYCDWAIRRFADWFVDSRICRLFGRIFQFYHFSALQVLPPYSFYQLAPTTGFPILPFYHFIPLANLPFPTPTRTSTGLPFFRFTVLAPLTNLPFPISGQYRFYHSSAFYRISAPNAFTILPYYRHYRFRHSPVSTALAPDFAYKASIKIWKFRKRSAFMLTTDRPDLALCNFFGGWGGGTSRRRRKSPRNIVTQWRIAQKHWGGGFN